MPILPRRLFHAHNPVQAIKAVSNEVTRSVKISTFGMRVAGNVPMPWRELRVEACPANDAYGISGLVRENQRPVIPLVEVLVLHDTLRCIVSKI